MTREKYQVSYSTVLATVSAIILTTFVFIFKLNEKKTKSIYSPQNKAIKKFSKKSSPKPHTNWKFAPSIKGLRNHGNSCYINCVLQSLFHTAPLAKYFLENELTNPNENEIICKFSHLINSMWRNTYDPVYSYELVESSCRVNKSFPLGVQQDTQEYLLWLLNSLKGTDQSTETNNFIQQVFGFELRSTIVCTECNEVKIMKSDELMLGLSIPVENPKFSVEVPFIFANRQSLLNFVEKNRKHQLSESSNSLVRIIVHLPTNLENHSDLKKLKYIKPFCDLGPDFVCVNTEKFGRNYTNEDDQLYDIWNKQRVFFMELPDTALEETKVVVINQMARNNQLFDFGLPFTLSLKNTCTYPEIRREVFEALSKLINQEELVYDPWFEPFCSLLIWNECENGFLPEGNSYSDFKPLLDKSCCLISNKKIFTKLIVRWNAAHLHNSASTAMMELLTTFSETGRMRQKFAMPDDSENTVSLSDCFNFWKKEKSELCVCHRCLRQIKNYLDRSISCPLVLIVHLQRYAFHKSTNIKLRTRVEFPIDDLDLSGFCTNTVDQSCYELYAVCYHSGLESSNGHYRARCKNFNNNIWYEFDDEKCKRLLNECDILKNIQNDACLLFYKKK